eukprot:COSAG01_NODE_3692_length_5789_cov_4.628295_11_plen_248_part_01
MPPTLAVMPTINMMDMFEQMGGGLGGGGADQVHRNILRTQVGLRGTSGEGGAMIASIGGNDLSFGINASWLPRPTKTAQLLECAAGDMADPDEASARLGVMMIRGASVNAWTEDGCLNTPLHLACEAGHSDIVSRLLAECNRPSARNSRGLTPLDVAAERGHTECIQLVRAELESQQLDPAQDAGVWMQWGVPPSSKFSCSTRILVASVADQSLLDAALLRAVDDADDTSAAAAKRRGNESVKRGNYG